MSEVVEVRSEVPFGRTLYGMLKLKDQPLDKLVHRGQMESHYLAWETVRKGTNPFFQKGTGFEGYLVGRCSNPEAALEAIIAANQHILDAITRLYRFEYQFRSRLMKTLTQDASDAEAIHVWSAYLGAELGKLRVLVFHNREAEAFQTRTYQIVRGLPPMVYHEVAEDVTQTYMIGADREGAGRLLVTLSMLKPSQQDAWLVAENIGEFGH
ncbi:MAG: hypothetical protein JNM70_20790, partial [Anaerolineae bacterium]|nr:hypothetical protein [Anaerolineae bacterium]